MIGTTREKYLNSTMGFLLDYIRPEWQKENLFIWNSNMSTDYPCLSAIFNLQEFQNRAIDSSVIPRPHMGLVAKCYFLDKNTCPLPKNYFILELFVEGCDIGNSKSIFITNKKPQDHLFKKDKPYSAIGLEILNYK